MKTICTILCLGVVLSSTAQIDSLIADGSTIAYYFGNSEFEKIQEYIIKNEFILDLKGSSIDRKIYSKNLEELDLLMLMVDLKEKRIGFSHFSENDPFFILKLSRECRSKQLIFESPEDPNIFHLLIPQPSHNRSDTDRYAYASAIVISEPLIWFYPPLKFDNVYKWGTALSEFLDLKK